jgi:hypothetical protein
MEKLVRVVCRRSSGRRLRNEEELDGEELIRVVGRGGARGGARWRSSRRISGNISSEELREELAREKLGEEFMCEREREVEERWVK